MEALSNWMEPFHTPVFVMLMFMLMSKCEAARNIVPIVFVSLVQQ